ncbi:MAG TPA: hypothetical protein VNL14_12580 [Candidatus Acidoferrales bacterium]|nr:hypothetical protein [Candidatus Acidoferrales bacterium]
MKKGRAPRILVYGFGPYGHFASNITARALEALAPVRNLKKIIFPVRFNEAQFVGAVRTYRPEIVLGLGQCARGASLRIETRAKNLKRERKSPIMKPIHPGGPRWLETTLPLRAEPQAKRSRDAGSYVCNFSMYVILGVCPRNHFFLDQGRSNP